MTNEDRAELIGAFNEGISGRFDPTNPSKPIARLRAAWAEASEFERMAFRVDISEAGPVFTPGEIASMISASAETA
jgi:hypothetical protein